MDAILEEEETKLKSFKTTRDTFDRMYWTQLDIVNKRSKKVKNPIFIALRIHLKEEALFELILNLLNLQYCEKHDTILNMTSHCIKCLSSQDIRDADRNDWIWFKIHDIQINEDATKIIGFHDEKDYYFYQHLLKMIPKPELYWMTEHYDGKLQVGIIEDKDYDYKIVIVNFEYDEDLDYILQGDLENAVNSQKMTFELKY